MNWVWNGLPSQFRQLTSKSRLLYNTRYYKIQDPLQHTNKLLDNNQALSLNGEPNTERLVGVVYKDPRMGFIGVHLETAIWLDDAIRDPLPLKVQPPDMNRGVA